MAKVELEDDTRGDLNEGLGESDDVRRIKEEWTRLQVAANSRNEEVLQTPPSPMAEAHHAKPVPTKVPPARLPSLESMVGRVPSIPSMEVISGLGKKLPELGSVGHHLGVMSDPKELEPQSVTLEKTSYSFGADTPTQTDIKWSPPANHAVFKSLVYNIEVDVGQGWETLTDNRLPILRAYFTSDKLLLGKFSRVQEAEPVAVRMRVRATGVVKARNQEEETSGPWSDEIWLSIEGSEVTSNTAV